ncbi:hypothetical protein CASFOL_006331 [Castilleja foliolosa]|uniref:Charged multivesicular body protein 5 n=1 Tax=Castilleja foliolosa TaxID=1961234 RepID=A0ABD3E627_9LAMI
MKRVFGLKKDKEPSTSIQDTSDRITKRGDNVEEKIKKLDADLNRYKEQIKKTRPGPAQEAVKARAIRALKQKRTYEGQREMLYDQIFNLDQAAYAAQELKDAQQTLKTYACLENLQEEMMDLIDVSNDIHESFGRSYYVPDEVDEDELLGQLAEQMF